MSKHHVCAFLLKGKVQGVKLRRYVEAAGRHYGVGGYVINTEDGDVWGEAFAVEDDKLHGFATWIRGEVTPAVYTNIKPTPIGTAYPEKAQVDQFAVRRYLDTDHPYFRRFAQFTMVRDDEEAAALLQERKDNQQPLCDALQGKEGVENNSIAIGVWPRR